MNDITLNSAEEKIKEEYIQSLPLPKKETENQVIVAMVGVVGSGKSFVAEKIASGIGATVISGDEIRVFLNSERQDWSSVDALRELAASHCIKRAGNIVIDSDAVAESRRKRLEELAARASVKVYYVQVTASPLAIIDRAKNADYSRPVDKVFSQKAQELGVDTASVKIFEFHRRAPLHFQYDWIGDFTGKWKPKKLDFVNWKVNTEQNNKAVSEQIDKIVEEIKQ